MLRTFWRISAHFGTYTHIYGTQPAKDSSLILKKQPKTQRKKFHKSKKHPKVNAFLCDLFIFLAYSF